MRFSNFFAFAAFFCAASPVFSQSERIARGKYLAEEVSRCQECHTPRNEAGEFDRTRWMKGMTLNIQPITPVKDWHKNAPDITPSGKLWNTWTEAGVLKFLETGLTPKGRHAGPPMPIYKLTAEDAAAIVAYLKTIE